MENFKRYIGLVENELVRLNLGNQPNELYEPMHYILQLGGKRLRPALSLAACELFGGKAEAALSAALGIELFHNFSLIHDDIMDEAPLRRKQPTVHEKWDTNIAILSGDGMLVKAYQLVAQVDSDVLPNVMETFSQTALEVCEGQQYDMNFEKQANVSKENYIEMIRLKTSVLLGAALKIGALVAKANPKDAEAIYNYGVNIGIAFQIQDDLLDSFGDPKKFGKQVGGDIINDKKTILMIHALEQANARQRTEILSSNLSGEKKVEKVKELYVALGAKQAAEELRDSYYDKAISNLEEISQSASLINDFKAFSAWLIQRDH